MDLDKAVLMILGGVGAISPDLYRQALAKIAELTGRDASDPQFLEDVQAECRKLPCPLD